VHQHDRHGRERADDDGERQGGDTGAQCVVAPYDLEVLGDEEDEAEQAEERQRHRAARGGEARVAEEAYVEQRVGAPALPEHERRKRRRGHRVAPEGGHRRPSVARRLDGRPDQHADGDDRADGTEGVEAAGGTVAGLREQAPPGDQGESCERHVHPEHRAPRVVLKQQATADRADGDGEAGDCRPDADRAGPLQLVGERGREQCQRRGVDERCTRAHGGPAGHELPGGLRERGPQRGDGEQGQPQLEHLASTEPVAEVPAEQQQAGEDERVGVDDPLQVARRRSQAAADGGQRHVDDRVVDADDQHRQAEDHEDPPPPVVFCSRPGLCLLGDWCLPGGWCVLDGLRAHEILL